MRIAIVGGGISGLAAAFRLNELLPQAYLTLFEASDRLGGVLQTVPTSGFLLERAADNFLTTPATAVDLCRRLGIADQLVSTNPDRRRAFVVRDGRLLPIPDGFYLMSPRKLWPILSSPLLSWAGKLRLMCEPLIPRRKPGQSIVGRRGQPPHRAAWTGQVGAFPTRPEGGQGEDLEYDDESVASFARRRLGQETLERLVQPLVAGIYTADPEQLSMAATLPQFVEYERKYGSLLRATLRSQPAQQGRPIPGSERIGPGDGVPPHPPPGEDRQASGARYGLFVAPKDGMSSLVQALAARLPSAAVRLNTRVSGIRPVDGGQWLIDFSTQQTSGGHHLQKLPAEPQSAANELFDAVVVALPAYAAARLCTGFDSDLAAELAAIPYAGCAVVSFGFARRKIGHALDGFGLVVPQREGRQILSASFASLKYPGRAPDDCVLIRAFLGGALQPELLGRSDEGLVATALGELRGLLAITGQPLIVDTARWPASMPQYHVGHLARVARIERFAARWRGLALAGNAYRGVGVPHCVQSGQMAAEHVAAG